MQKMAMAGKFLLVTAIVSGGVWFRHYFQQKDHNEHVELAEMAKDKFDSLGLALNGKLAFSEKSANTKCNWSKYLVVYSSEDSPLELCSRIAAHLQGNGWEQVQRCRTIEVEAGGVQPAFKYVVEQAINRTAPYPIFLSGYFYPKEAPASVSLMNHARGDDIGQHAKRFRSGFYALSYEFQGPYDSFTLACKERECECAYSSYSSSIFSDGRKYLWEK